MTTTFVDPTTELTVERQSPPGISGLSVRIFGLSSWSVLAPQALEGVATVGLLYATVRRTSGAAAGLLAGTVLALTPAAALMFRYNHPDALLVLPPTLAQFEAYLKAGQIHYFISGGQGMGGRGMGGNSGSAIANWVAQHCKATTVGGYAVYDLTSSSS